VSQQTGSNDLLDEDLWDLAVDVLVIGSGAAGHAAAIAAADQGAAVAIVEGSKLIGGTTAKSWRATFWIPNNHLLRRLGTADPKDAALRYMCRLAHPAAYHPQRPYLGLRRRDHELIEAFYDQGPVAIEELERLGAIDAWLDMEIPDYHAESADDLVPYGRHMRSAGPVGVTLADDEHRLLTGLSHAAAGLGVRTLLDHRVVSLVTDEDNTVLGCEVHAGRDTVLVRARRGIVFATGGFTHDVDLCEEFLRGPIVGGCAHDSAVGDIFRILSGQEVRLGAMADAWWAEAPVEFALRHRATETDLFMPFGDSMIFVNRKGHRVMSEKLPYAERARVHHVWDPVEAIYSNLLLFMVYDEHVAQHPQVGGRRWPIPLPGEDASHVVSGASWPELSDNLAVRLKELALPGLPADGLAAGFADELAATVARFGGFARTGVDEDFRRGSRAIELAWQEPGPLPGEERPNPSLRAFDPTGPYHAIVLGPSALDTKGGPQTDVHGRLLDMAGRSIPGLYGAGNCVASPSGEAYWAAGATIGLALTFGYVAGRSAAQQEPAGQLG
jgi:3-oxosteroid 1-dehydrogenase